MLAKVGLFRSFHNIFSFTLPHLGNFLEKMLAKTERGKSKIASIILKAAGR